VLAEQVPDLADRAVLVVGQRLDEKRHAARAVALVGDLLVLDARLLARAAADGARDVLARHVVRLGFGDDRAEARITVGIAAAAAGGDRQLLDEPREDLAALGIGGTLLVLDGVPLGMARHVENSPEVSTNSSRSFGSFGRSDCSRRADNQAFRARMTQTSALGSHRPPR